MDNKNIYCGGGNRRRMCIFLLWVTPFHIYNRRYFPFGGFIVGFAFLLSEKFQGILKRYIAYRFKGYNN